MKRINVRPAAKRGGNADPVKKFTSTKARDEKRGLDETAARLRESAAYMEKFSMGIKPCVKGLVSLLDELKGKEFGSPEMVLEYNCKLTEASRKAREFTNNELLQMTGAPDDDPARVAFRVYEHHFFNLLGSVNMGVSISAKKPERAREMVERGAKNLNDFIRIMESVKRDSDPNWLALVFSAGDSHDHLDKLRGY